MPGLYSLLPSVFSLLASRPGISYRDLEEKYKGFTYPQASIELNGKIFTTPDMAVNDLSIELSSGFEASVARFRIYNVFDQQTGKIRYDEIKKSVMLGAELSIKFGYLGELQPVFVGFVAGVDFGFDLLLPYIEVTGMDVKGIMMANSYATQLTASSYSEAVSEIMKRTAYKNLKSSGAIKKILVTDTPDKGKASFEAKNTKTNTIEMVSESDYEFVVKAAKKFNYEFFVRCGTVYFRKAKNDTSKVITLGSSTGMVTFNIGYSINGLVEEIEVRSMDVGSGKVIAAKQKLTKKISTGNMAKELISDSKKVYIDPTITSQEQADARAAYLMEQMSYRLGTLTAKTVGIPELLPGQYIKVEKMGSPVDNYFYLTQVVHTFNDDTGYCTHITGIASEVK